MRFKPRHAAAVRRPRRLLAVPVGLLLAAALSGCQKATDVGIYNACGFAVEAGLEEVGYSQDVWIELNDGEHRGVRSASEDGTKYFVWVRTAVGALREVFARRPVTEFTVWRDDLSPPPQGNTYDLEIVLEGDRCPAPADRAV